MGTRHLLERLVMVPVHVADEEIVHGHVHQVEQPSALVVGRDVPHHAAVISIRLPLRLPALMVAATPRVPPYLVWRGEVFNI